MNDKKEKPGKTLQIMPDLSWRIEIWAVELFHFGDEKKKKIKRPCVVLPWWSNG